MTKRQRVLVSFLALHTGRAVATERVIDAVWNGKPPNAARASLQNQIARLRATFGADVIHTTGEGYRLGCGTDAERFEATIHLPLRTIPGPTAAGELEKALRSWRGRPYDDLDAVDGVESARARLEELHALAEEQFAACRLATGEVAAHLGEFAGLVASQPLRERRWALLMRGLASAGRPAEAIDAFAQLRIVLAEELGTEPSAELVVLKDAIEHRAPVHTPAGDVSATLDPLHDTRGCGRRVQRRRRICPAR